MEYRNWWMIYAGLGCMAVILFLFAVIRPGRKKFKRGIKVASEYLYRDDPYYKRRIFIYRFWLGIVLLSLLAAVMAGSYLLTRPYTTTEHQEEKYSRDIILCLDVSTSVNSMNERLVKELRETISHFKGERIGIVIFNTSPVLLTPLTDDYDYLMKQFDDLEKGLEGSIYYNSGGEFPEFDYELYYWEQYIMSGTLIGNDERGSSLVGDGLAGSLYHFSDYEQQRPRVVIFSTDNDVYETGKGQIVNLMQAAALCKKKGVAVYGIGTKEMKQEDMDEMRKAMELTGGKFYLEENTGAFEQIVNDIDTISKEKIIGRTYITEMDQPRLGFLVLLCAMAVFFVACRRIRR